MLSSLRSHSVSDCMDRSMMIVIAADLHHVPAALRPLETAAHDLARDIQRIADRLIGHGQTAAVSRAAHERVIGGAHSRYPLLAGAHDDERRLQGRLLLDPQ